MNQMRILAVIAGVLGCALVLADSAQAGDVYKYVDERGATMYTDKPIPGAVLVSTGTQRPPEVTQRSYAAAQATSNSQLAASNQRISADQNNTRAASTVAKDLEANRKQRCQEARDGYQRSINSIRIYREKPDGTREYLSEAELAQARVDAYKMVEAVCGPQG
jgi:hypothetical protein